MAGDAHRTNVGDYVTLVRGTTYKGRLVGEPGPALLGLGSIEPGGGFRIGNYKTYGGDCPDELMLFPGDIYASLKGATKDGKMIGSVARVPPSVLTGRLTQDTVKLVFRSPNPDDANYLHWVLRTPQYRDYCAGHAMGSAVVALSRRDFLSYPVPPPTMQRRKLVALLDAIEAKIDLIRRMKETLEAMARLLFKSWFVDFDPVRAKADGRDPGLPKPLADLFPACLVDSELGEIPEGWEVKPLGELIQTVKGTSYKSEELVESDTALVTLKSFARGGGYRADGLKSFTGTYKPEQIVKPGELVIACTDVTQAAEVIGRPAMIRGTSGYHTLVASLDTLIVRPRHSSMTRAFLYFLGGTDGFVAHTYAHTTGTTVLHLAKEAVPSFTFARPSMPLVKQFDALADPALSRIQTLEEESDTLSVLRETLLPKLISGELQVKDAVKVIGRAE